jgi:hypothetical protein
MGDKLTKQKADQVVVTISCSNPKDLHNITVLLNDAPEKANSILPLLPAGSRYIAHEAFKGKNGTWHIRIYFEAN